MTKYDLDEYNRHSLYLERLAFGGINSVVLPSLQDTYKAIAAILGDYDKIEDKAQLNAIMRAIKTATEENSGWFTLTQDDLQPLALYEAAWQASYAEEMTELSTKIPAERTILGFINTALMSLESGQRSDVGLWSDFVKSNVDSRSEQINNVVQRGFMRGETIASMRKEIKGLSEGLLRREAESLARTGYVHYAAQATEAMVRQNTDILEQYYYVVTWDSRTSNICKSVTRYNEPKNRFKVGDSKAPQVPLHFGCRTRRLGVPKGFELVGTRSAVGGRAGAQAEAKAVKRQSRKRKGKIKYKGHKDSDIFTPGQVNAGQSTADWFKSQPLWWLELNMGRTRAKLVKDGGLSIHNLTDAKLKTLTLDELEELHPQAFKKAGV